MAHRERACPPREAGKTAEPLAPSFALRGWLADVPNAWLATDMLPVLVCPGPSAVKRGRLVLASTTALFYLKSVAWWDEDGSYPGHLNADDYCRRRHNKAISSG